MILHPRKLKDSHQESSNRPITSTTFYLVCGLLVFITINLIVIIILLLKQSKELELKLLIKRSIQNNKKKKIPRAPNPDLKIFDGEVQSKTQKSQIFGINNTQIAEGSRSKFGYFNPNKKKKNSDRNSRINYKRPASFPSESDLSALSCLQQNLNVPPSPSNSFSNARLYPRNSSSSSSSISSISNLDSDSDSNE